MTAVGLLLAGLGVVLMTAGIKDQDPREMVVGAISGSNPTGKPRDPNSDQAIATGLQSLADGVKPA